MCHYDAVCVCVGGVSEVLSAETLGTDQSMFVIVAIGNRGLLAAGSLLVQRPTTTPIGTCGVHVCVRKSPYGPRLKMTN